jgi:hypothetical protein
VTATQFLQNRATDQMLKNAVAGGAIYNLGITTISANSKFISNTSDQDAGAIYNASATATLNIQDTSFNGNVANAGNGGAIVNDSTVATGGLVVIKSSFWTNQAANGRGGAIYNTGVASMSNSTVNNNTANKGGNLAASNKNALEKLTLTNVTDANGKAVRATLPGAGASKASAQPLDSVSLGEGGGIYIESGAEVLLYNTIVATNTADDDSPDVFGAVDPNSSNNLIGDGTGSSGFNPSTNLIGTTAAPINPQFILGFGYYNESDTPILPISNTNPARNAGSVAFVDQSTDQNGLPRINPNTGTVDIGAVEWFHDE